MVESVRKHLFSSMRMKADRDLGKFSQDIRLQSVYLRRMACEPS
jgi:hypothetical protein